jgi:2,3,4,5-tetrahydropyridine-2-carboxylate N-succinyltransferase
VIEDDAFIGSRSMVVEGARVRRGAKLGAGAILTSSTRVFDATSGDELPRGEVPERAVVVGSSKVRSFPGGEFAMPCLLVLRTLEEGEIHDKLALNDVLREHGVAT